MAVRSWSFTRSFFIYAKQSVLRMGFKISEEAALAPPIAARSWLSNALAFGFAYRKYPNPWSLTAIKIAHGAQIFSGCWVCLVAAKGGWFPSPQPPRINVLLARFTYLF